MEQDKIPEVDKVDEVDFDRWYRELFKKFTTIRDAYEMNGVGNANMIEFAQIGLNLARREKTKEGYEDMSRLLNVLMKDLDQK